MSRDDPVLSVVIPVWNAALYLGEAITSVLTQVGLPAVEVIVVDDGSVDDSAMVADSFGPPVRCLRVSHGGLAAARNAGMNRARGRYLLHLDSDDVLPAESIRSRLAAFSAEPETDLVIGQMTSFISPELDDDVASRFTVAPGPQRGGLPGATLVRAEFSSRVGPFDSARDHSPDLDWMARAMEHRPRVVELPSVVLRRRIHGANLSLRQDRVAADRLAVIRSTLRRRQDPGEADVDRAAHRNT